MTLPRIPSVTSAASSPHTTAGIAAVAYAALGWALFRSRGFLDGVSLLLVLVSLALATGGLLMRRAPRLDRFAARMISSILGVIVIAELLIHGSTTPGINSEPETAPTPFSVGIIVAGTAMAGYAWRRLPRRQWLFPAVVFIYLFLGGWVIQASPRPFTDVWRIQQEAAAFLLRGENPYAESYPNIYGPEAAGVLYGTRVLDRGERILSFPYPPLSLLTSAAGYLLGDIRWSFLAALVGSAAVALAAARRLGLPPGHTGELAILSLLFHPSSFFILEQGWTEPLVAFAVACAVWAMVVQQRFLLGVGLAAVMSVKQYGLLWVLACWCFRRVHWRNVLGAALLTALLAAPFFFWDRAAFLRGTVTFEMNAPFRPDALAVFPYVAQRSGLRPSLAVVGLSSMGAVVVILLLFTRVRQHSLGRALLGSAALYLAFFVLNKQAFVNYYWFAGVLLTLSIVTALAEGAAADVRNQAIDHLVNRHTRCAPS